MSCQIQCVYKPKKKKSWFLIDEYYESDSKERDHSWQKHPSRWLSRYGCGYFVASSKFVDICLLFLTIYEGNNLEVLLQHS